MKAIPFNVSEAYKLLELDDKQHVKMLLRVDDHIARVFFTNNVVIIEGDTEEILIKETIKRMSHEKYLKIVSDFEIVKARGKASIIGLVKYLISMGIEPIVVHDTDAGTERAEIFNKPIADALNGKGKIIQMNKNVEDEVGYTAPSSEKPLRAFTETSGWGDDWSGVPENWKNKMREIFGEYIPTD